MTQKERNNIFISDCGEFVAIRLPGPIYPAFDVWRHDGSEMWEGSRYVPVPSGKPNCYNPRTLYTEEFTHPKKIAGSWSNRGHEKRNGEWVEGFELLLHDLETKESIYVGFHTPLHSIAPLYQKRRQANEGEER